MLDKKAFAGNMAIKFYIIKAFYTLDWSFLLQSLKAFGFHDIFTGWILKILKSAKLSVLINGSPHGFFNCERG